jgi:hypothetical protein
MFKLWNAVRIRARARSKPSGLHHQQSNQIRCEARHDTADATMRCVAWSVRRSSQSPLEGRNKQMKEYHNPTKQDKDYFERRNMAPGCIKIKAGSRCNGSGGHACACQLETSAVEQPHSLSARPPNKCWAWHVGPATGDRWAQPNSAKVR